MGDLLGAAFANTLAPDPALIRQSEAYLKEAAAHPGYAVKVLELLSQEAVPEEIRQAAAVNFKNHVRFHWVQRSGDEADASAIQEPEKEQVKAHITDLMLRAPPRVRAQLSEALSIVSSHDFPARWPGLLPQLLERLGGAGDDLAMASGVLGTADSIYRRYRDQFMTDQLSQELDYSQQLVAPLLEVLRGQTRRLAEAGPAGDPTTLRALCTNAELVANTFYSLNSPGLTDAFEETLDAWMAEFHALLTFETAGLGEKDVEKEGVLDACKASVCECLILFMERNEEEFAKFLQTFVQDIWTLLLKVTQDKGQDRLALNAINFLTTVARSVHFALFKDPATLRQVCESIVVPNLRMRPDDEEMFEMNWVEYVRRDTEGSDSDTRRRAASELVKALTERFPTEVTELFSGYVGAMLAEAAQAASGGWKAKDCAIYLVTALTVRGKTAAQGATSTNTLVNLQDFFAQHIAPELAAPQSGRDGAAVLAADALKFVTTFRSQLPKSTCLALFPLLTTLLGSESNVVHSYAAICVERLLAMRGDGNTPRYQPAELASMLQPLLEKLFAAFALPESGENEYLMKCVLRVISFVGATIAPVAAACLAQLSRMLLRVCANPTQPGFNHYLFESVAALVRFGCEASPQSVSTYEEMLFPPFQVVLQDDVQEFHPYVFQIFAQLIELRPAGAALPEIYMALFQPLLTPLFWERSGNIPALVRLLEAYLGAAAGEIAGRGLLPPLLGVFQKLVASRAHDHEGFRILEALAQNLPAAALAPTMPQIWTLLFQRLQSSRTNKFVRCFVSAAALFVCKHGAASTLDSMDAVQQGLGVMVLQSVWLPAMGSVVGAYESKVVAVATAKVVCEAAQVQGPPHAGLRGMLLEALVKYVAGGGSSADEGAEDGGAGEEDVGGGYSAAYARLHHAARVERDPLPEVSDVRAAVVRMLATYAAQSPGALPSLIQASLAADLAAQLQSWCAAAGVTLV